MSIALEWAERLQDTPLGIWIAESAVAYPVIEGLHLIGLAVSFGLLALTDLRLLGLFLRQVPATEVLHQLRPWVLGGYAVTFVTGGLLFWAGAVSLIENPSFLLKLVLIALAGLNALYFEIRIARAPAFSGSGAAAPSVAIPAAVRFAGLASLGLWSAVIIAGRMIPYVDK